MHIESGTTTSAARQAGTESGLIRRAQAGELAAFEALYRANVERVYALCLRMCANRPWAEELTQDVFVRAWRKLAGFRGEARFSSWLYRLAVNVVLRAVQDAKRQRERERKLDPETANMSAAGGSPALRMDLDAAISRLPEQARIVFVLHDISGYRHGEIALLMSISTGTSKSQLHRARQLLRKELET